MEREGRGEQVSGDGRLFSRPGPRLGEEDGMGAGGMAPVPPGTVEKKQLHEKKTRSIFSNYKQVQRHH